MSTFTFLNKYAIFPSFTPKTAFAFCKYCFLVHFLVFIVYIIYQITAYPYYTLLSLYIQQENKINQESSITNIILVFPNVRYVIVKVQCCSSFSIAISNLTHLPLEDYIVITIFATKQCNTIFFHATPTIHINLFISHPITSIYNPQPSQRLLHSHNCRIAA